MNAYLSLGAGQQSLGTCQADGHLPAIMSTQLSSFSNSGFLQHTLFLLSLFNLQEGRSLHPDKRRLYAVRHLMFLEGSCHLHVSSALQLFLSMAWHLVCASFMWVLPQQMASVTFPRTTVLSSPLGLQFLEFHRTPSREPIRARRTHVDIETLVPMSTLDVGLSCYLVPDTYYLILVT